MILRILCDVIELVSYKLYKKQTINSFGLPYLNAVPPQNTLATDVLTSRHCASHQWRYHPIPHDA